MVAFGEWWLTLGNIRMVREADPYSRAFELSETKPEDRRLLEGSLNSLGTAYLLIGEPEKGHAIFRLNLKLHPENETAQRLAGQ